jgi:hypothetical protein
MGEPRVNDGGPAYPQPREFMDQGLSVRDVFACHALPLAGKGLSIAGVARMAYEVADAMIARRARDYARAAAATLPEPVADPDLPWTLDEEPTP